MIKYYLRNPDWKLERATIGASGFDLRYDGDVERELGPGIRWLVPTGLHLEMPRGVEAQVRSRSGLAINHGICVLNAPGTVDSDYRGEVKVTLINLGQQPWKMLPGDRIAQLVFAPVFGGIDHVPGWSRQYLAGSFQVERVPRLEDLSSTDRGDGGHGSTGR